MGGAFLTLAWMWRSPDENRQPSAGAFLAIYALFFLAVGLHQLALNTINGKLVAVRRRGALLSCASFVGGIGAVTCIWFLIRPWLSAWQRILLDLSVCRDTVRNGRSLHRVAE